MKNNNLLSKFKIISMVLVFTFAFSKAWSTGIVGWTLLNNNTANSGLVANNACTITHSTAGAVSYNAAGAQVASWDGNNSSTIYWTSSVFTTSNYINLYVVAQMKSDATGPKNFQLQYKIGTGSWTNTGTAIVLSSSQVTTGNISLPDECSNQSSVSIRFLRVNNTSVNNGTVAAGAKSYIRNIEVNGVAPSTPSSQAAAISLVSITPTTITVTANTGNGSHWILKMNTTNSFTTPTSNSNPTANLTYNGGEQVIANELTGVGSVTVTVPSANNEYWFRAYAYNYNDGMTRFNPDEVSPSNPKFCALENIHSPTYINVRLATATLGGTIATPLAGTVSDRGIFWATHSDVNQDDNVESQSSASGGPFTLGVSNLSRSQTIYFKAYVTNESGTIMTGESSFTNVPIFTGTGSWETAARWSVLEIPGAMGLSNGDVTDSPIINGNCTLTSSNSCENITINSGSGKSLLISPNINLYVNNTLTNNNGVAGLVLKSNAIGTGTLLHNTDNVDASIERYISGSSILTSKKYHLVSVPITSLTYQSEVWLDSYLFSYLEANNTWFSWNDPVTNTLQTHEGAMIFYPAPSKTYNIIGKLNNGSYSPTVAYSGVGNGFNLIPNPYPSAIDWNAPNGWSKNNISGTIWGFSPTAQNYGSWNGSTGTNSVTNIIPIGQAFFAVADANSPELTMNNEVRLDDDKAFMKSVEIVPNIFHLTTTSDNGQDEIAIQFAYDATNLSIDKYDAIKLYSALTVPQLSSYTAEDGKLLSISGLPFIETSTIVPLRLEMSTTSQLTFTASALESFETGVAIQLEDKQLAQLIDLRLNPIYTFNHTPEDAGDRFALHFGSVLGIDDSKSLQSKITVSGHEIYMKYSAETNNKSFVGVYDIQGRMINKISLSGSGSDHISIKTTGVYLIKLYLSTGVETHKIVVI